MRITGPGTAVALVGCLVLGGCGSGDASEARGGGGATTREARPAAGGSNRVTEPAYAFELPAGTWIDGSAGAEAAANASPGAATSRVRAFRRRGPGVLGVTVTDYRPLRGASLDDVLQGALALGRRRGGSTGPVVRTALAGEPGYTYTYRDSGQTAALLVTRRGGRAYVLSAVSAPGTDAPAGVRGRVAATWRWR